MIALSFVDGHLDGMAHDLVLPARFPGAHRRTYFTATFTVRLSTVSASPGVIRLGVSRGSFAG